MKRILATLVFLSVALSAWCQPYQRNFFDTNQNPIVDVVAGVGVTVTPSLIGVDHRRFTVSSTGGAATNLVWPVAGTNVILTTNAFEVTINADVGHAEVNAASNTVWVYANASSNALWIYTTGVSNAAWAGSNALWGFTSGTSNNVITTSNILWSYSTAISNVWITGSNALYLLIGGSQTPWLQTEDAAGFSLTNVFHVRGSNAIFGIRNGTGLNAATGFGANILGSALDGTNQASGYGSLIDGVATNGGLNLASGIGSRVMGNSDASINQATGYGASVVGNTTNLSLNTASGTGARVVGYASNGSTNEASGMGSSLSATADGGGYNQVTGNRSLSIGATGAAGGKNINNADDSLSVSVAAGGTNLMDGLKSSTMLLGVAVGGGENLITSDAFGGVTQGTSLLFGSAASKGINRIFQHGNNGRNAMLFGSMQSGGSNVVAGSSIGILLGVGGTNVLNGNSSVMIGSSVASGYNEVNTGPNILVGVASQGTNVLSGQFGTLIGEAGLNGVNLNSATGGTLIGYAVGGANTMTGTGGALISYADAVVGGTANNSDRSFVLGAGGTNTANDALVYYSRGTPLIFAATNAVGISTNNPQFTLHVNGSLGSSNSYRISPSLTFADNEHITEARLQTVVNSLRSQMYHLWTNINPVITSNFTLGVTEPSDQWLTNALSTGSNHIGYFYFTNGIGQAELPSGNYNLHIHAFQTGGGAPVVTIGWDLVVWHLGTNFIVKSGETITSGTIDVGFDLGAFLTTNYTLISSNDFIGVHYYASKSGAAVSLLTHLDGTTDCGLTTPGIGPIPSADTATYVTSDPITNHVYYTNLIGSTRQTMWIDAGAMSVGADNGPSMGFYQPTNGANPYVDVWDFDATNPQTNYFKLMMPDSWDLGTVKLKFFYFQAAETSTGNSNVWAVCAKKFSKGDTLFGSGTEVSVTNACVNSTNKLNVCTSPAVTVSGTPALGDMIVFQVRRVADSGWDTGVGYARLTGVAMQWLDTHTNSPAW